jgi:acyl phosphate:glycerol-3-phosphate acyltransferase
MFYLLSSIIGYLLGSIPSGYLVLKRKGIDIINSGTGNVGAMNSFEITNSKITGLIVFFIDAIKGLLSVYIPLLLFPFGFGYAAISLLFAVLSHCYNPWIKFRGGRGLATSLGGTLLIAPFIPTLWIFFWIVVFVIKKDIILGNLAAILLTVLVILSFPETVFQFSFPRTESISSLMFFSFGLLIIIFIKHIDPMVELLIQFNIIKKKDDN